MSEGSTFTEGIDSQPEDTSSEQENSSSEDTGSKETVAAEQSDSKVEGTDSTLQSTDQETKYTEKGTKLDSNPMSALNQQLANERRQRTTYEKVLNDPDQLVAYAKTMGVELSKKEAEKLQEEQQIDPSKIETVEDLQGFAKQLEKKYEKQSQEVDKSLQGFKESDEIEAVSRVIKTDIDAVREKYPELDPKSESYDPNLEETIGKLYQTADFDTIKNRYIGKARIGEIADMVMGVRGSAKTAGSKEAQTIVKDKRRGSVLAGGKETAPDESNMSPAQSIASRMAQARKAMGS